VVRIRVRDTMGDFNFNSVETFSISSFKKRGIACLTAHVSAIPPDRRYTIFSFFELEKKPAARLLRMNRYSVPTVMVMVRVRRVRVRVKVSLPLEPVFVVGFVGSPPDTIVL
jgi:hypothetical protein